MPLSAKFYEDILKAPPDMAAEGVFRYWWLFDREDVTVALFEVTGQLPPHKHPDGDHMGIILEGHGHCLSGQEYFEVGPREYIQITRNDPHNFYVPEGGRVVGIEMTAPRCTWDNVIFVADGPELEAIEEIRRRYGQVGVASSQLAPDPSLPKR